MSRHATVLLIALAMLGPAALAHHTPPAMDKVDGGRMHCGIGDDGRPHVGGTALSTTLPLLRTTDNGHLIIYASASAPRDQKCEFDVKITGYTLPGGVNPQGGLTNVMSTPCWAGGACTAWAEADWWVTFVDPINGVYTPEIDVHFALVVNGIVVDTGVVRIVEPSVPVLSLP